ncbi:MAG: hypothetical protein ACJ76N_27115 [Thermoanaerobaculia bacterium]
MLIDKSMEKRLTLVYIIHKGPDASFFLQRYYIPLEVDIREAIKEHFSSRIQLRPEIGAGLLIRIFPIVEEGFQFGIRHEPLVDFNPDGPVILKHMVIDPLLHLPDLKPQEAEEDEQ